MIDSTPKATKKTKKKTRSTKKSIDPALEEKLKIARNLKAMGLPVEQIMLATGLTQEEANEL
jgi:predicted transposase YdaD